LPNPPPPAPNEDPNEEEEKLALLPVGAESPWENLQLAPYRQLPLEKNLHGGLVSFLTPPELLLPNEDDADVEKGVLPEDTGAPPNGLLLCG
jgi:hypothetical protein